MIKQNLFITTKLKQCFTKMKLNGEPLLILKGT